MKTKLKYLIPIFLQSSIFLFSGVIPNLYTNDIQTTRNNSVYIIGIMVEFQPETIDDPRTTGSGTFLLESNIDSLVTCYQSQESRCDGFLVDPPPHNALYFEDQIKAVKNYYLNISKGNIDSFEYDIIETVYQLDKTMSEYSEMSSYDEPEEAIAYLYSEGLELASLDIEILIEDNNLNLNEVLIVMFHAGMGEDYTFEGYLDPANYDIRSAYIEESMLGLVPNDSWMKQNSIVKGLLLPEGLNLIYYDTIDDIYGCSQNMLCDTQIGMTGLFAYLLGYEFGLPEMFNRTNGKTGIGQFGLMDVGSFNLRGTLPSPPNPWSRISISWDESDIIDHTMTSQNLIPSRYPVEINDLEPSIYRLNISASEYYLIENINNHIVDELSIEDIQYSDSLYSTEVPDSVLSIFDRLLFIDQFNEIVAYSDECNETSLLTISDETNVILCAKSYDYGLPGRGLSIWHVNESNLSSLNDDIDNRTVKLVEADGAQDIGYQNYMYPIANPSAGWKWDLWFPDNEAYFFVNDNQNNLNFNSYTIPSSFSNEGSRTYMNIYDIEYLDDSSSMRFMFIPEQDLFISEPISDSTNFNVVGSGLFTDSNNNMIGYIIIDNTDANELQIIFSTGALLQEESIYDEDYFSVLGSDLSINTCLNSYYYDFESDQCLELVDYTPRGYFIDSMNLSDIPEEFREIDYLRLAIGDINQDGIDEILELSDGMIMCFNKNGTSCNNFPIEGDFHNNILVANLVDDDYPELIVRNQEEIQIISHDGELLYRIPSEFSSSLYVIPNWNDYIALVDGKRKILFSQPEAFNGYWLNPGGLSNNQPDVNPFSIHMQSETNTNSNVSEFYNYPNPIHDGTTTFRCFINSIDELEIKIYSASGFLVDKINYTSTYQNEYNEIIWDANGINPGVYLANLIAYSNGKQKDSKIIKVLITGE